MNSSSHINELPLAGYSIISATTSTLNSILQERLAIPEKTVLLFANTNFSLKCQDLRPWLNSEEVIIVNDGIGLDIAALLIHGNRYTENLNGTDFSPYFLKKISSRRKLFLLGGRPGVAERAGKEIGRQYSSQIVGCIDGYTKMSPTELINSINESKAEIVFVAMGNPIQEQWIYKNRHALDATLFIGVGALFDFLSGGMQRAPKWVQRVHCEWLFRLCNEPLRLFRRYTIDVISFLILCIKFRTLDKK